MANTNWLLTGRSLYSGDRLTSTDNRFVLLHQYDGNVVLYEKETGKALWATNTYGLDTAEFIMQEDGNLVLYAPKGKAVWASHSNGAQAPIAVMHNDGNFVVKDCNGKIAWATNTSQGIVPRDSLNRDLMMRPGDELVSKSGKNKIVFQEDGNIALLKSGRLVWDTKTGRSKASTLLLQLDGNMVLYNDEGPVWASSTWRKDSQAAVVQDDGNFVIYGHGGVPVWATDTTHV